MAKRKVPATGRDRRSAARRAEAARVGYRLAIALAARDAHASACGVNGFDCSLCRMYAELIAEATSTAPLDALPREWTGLADDIT